MSVTKLTYFLERLSQEERDDFRGNLVRKPGKRDEILSQLVEILMEGEAENEEIYAQLYPDREYSEKQMRNLRSELFSRLTDYLSNRLFEESTEKVLFVARVLNQLKVVQHFPAVVEKYMRREENDTLSLERADLNNRLKEEFLEYQISIQGRKGLPLNELMEGTEEAFVARVLYQAIAYQESVRIYPGFAAEPPLILLDSILEKLREGAWQHSRLVGIYYGLYQLVTEPEKVEGFFRVKEMLGAYGGLIEKREAFHIYTAVLNYLARRRNSGYEEVFPEIFLLYQEMLNRGLLLEDNVFNAWHFKSIVSTAIRLEKFAWALDFIQIYGPQLSAQFQANTVNYSRGMIAYYQNRFEEAETLMNKVLEDFSDPFFGLDARSYLLRIYYETGNVTGQDALLNSFRLFLTRHQDLLPDRLENYKEFIRFFRRLVALPPDKPGRAEKLRQEILDSPRQAGRDWLLQKLERFLK
ncbi:MAG: tetratricopeptide repeat protein [Bacteroidia bacterium]|nr:tetratricopeptide repeat protein [Bacteroidia bacterium]